MAVTNQQAPMSFSDSDNSSSVCFPDLAPASTAAELYSPFPTPDVGALRIFSANLDSTFRSIESNSLFADAHISVSSSVPPSPREVPVHRYMLASRSPFFLDLFVRGEENSEKPRAMRDAVFKMKDLARDFEVGYDALKVVLRYMYSATVGPFNREICVCVDDDCPHVGCRPAVDFLVQVLYASFTFRIPELVSLFQRHLLDILEKVAEDDISVILFVANLCDKACGRLLTRCIEIVVNSNLDTTTLEKALPHDVVNQILESRKNLAIDGPELIGFPDKHVQRIHRSLDSDDVELVRMLLKEGHTSLDDAHALHYAVAHCDSKTTLELLDFELADVNHRNPRGYTVLHIAAMRKEPKIIVSLLTKGARSCDLTTDGRNALQISKRLTKYVDYHRSTEEGKSTPGDRLCVEILEQAERRDPLLGEASVSLAMAGDDLRSRLLYLENRVGLARLLFPMEARVAMDIAQVDGTLEFKLGSNTNPSAANQRSSTVDLNETPFRIKEEHLSRMRALSKTVELGKRFFPRCSRVLDKIMDDDVAELAGLGDETSGERFLKKRRYQELQEDIGKAFTEDKEEYDKTALSSISSSSSTSTLVGGPRTKFTRK